jgi:hypothetical protein
LLLYLEVDLPNYLQAGLQQKVVVWQYAPRNGILYCHHPAITGTAVTGSTDHFFKCIAGKNMNGFTEKQLSGQLVKAPFISLYGDLLFHTKRKSRPVWTGIFYADFSC